jgi:UDP-N-acetylmuramate dehydrogenase
MEGAVKEILTSLAKGEICFDVPMARHTSLRVGGSADVLAFPRDEEDLRKLLRFARENDIPYYTFGKGTNVIVRDKGIRGMVISLCRGFKRVKVISREGKEVSVSAEAGGSLKRLVRFTMERNGAGLEAFAGIPGTVGGALVMNAGAFGSEMGNVVQSVALMDGTGNVVLKLREELEFHYRHLNLPEGSIILRATLGLKEANVEEIVAKIEDFQRLRSQSQPWKLPSAGSIFKNPEGTPAGKLIDELGLKGHRIGGARISEKHGNFIVTQGDATAGEVLALMAFMSDEVYEKRGLRLIPEVLIVGEE